MNHGHLDGRHGMPGNAAQPVRRDDRVRQQLRVRGPQLCAGGQRLHDGVAGELGVPLPFDRVTLEAQTQEVAVQAVQRQFLLPGQAAQMVALLLARHARVEHGHINDEGWQPHAGRGPRMHFVVQLDTQGIVRRQKTGDKGSGRRAEDHGMDTVVFMAVMDAPA